MPPRWGNIGYRSRPSPGQSKGPAGMGGSPHGGGLMKNKNKPTTGTTKPGTGGGYKHKPKPTTGTTKPGTGGGYKHPKPDPKPDNDKKDDDKKTFIDRYKGATTLAAGSTALLGATVGTRKYKQIQDIKKINKWTDRVNRKFGKSYSQLGKKINPSLMAKTSGQFIPSKIYAKTGHPAGISNWWNKRSSPTHFAGAEKFVNPILKTSAKLASKFLGPASLLISTPANASEDERMAIINAQWAEEKNKENKVWDGEKFVDKNYPVESPIETKSDIGGLMKNAGSMVKDKVRDIMDERGLLSKDEKIVDKAVDTIKRGKDVILDTATKVKEKKEEIIPEGSVGDTIIKEGGKVIGNVIKGEPEFQYEFDAPWGGTGTVEVSPSNKSGGVFIKWNF